jgi:succinyl-CoA synthetase beta subunit
MLQTLWRIKPFTQLRTSLFLHRDARMIQKRLLSLHEYQSQTLMKEFGIRVPPGGLAITPNEAESVARALDTQDLVVKAQILAGGRSLGVFENGFKGGVHICSSPEEVKEIATKMLGYRLITKQTGSEGKLVDKVLVSKRFFIRKEMYLALLLDRTSGGPVIMASSKGGVDIEKVAQENPNDIVKEVISDMDVGPTEQQIKNIAQKLHLPSDKVISFSDQLNRMYKLMMQKDALMIEINPFVETSNGELMCMDAKLNFDDNAAYRQKDIFAMEDMSQRDPREQQAAAFDLNYIGLDGNIGCLVNGAGLAMATMDIIKLCGGKPANFLDVGGGASQRQVTEAIKILSLDPNVKVILINIFGGIMRCDVIALGLIAACTELSLKIPIVARLQGTNVKEAKELIEKCGLRIVLADDLEMAAERSVKMAHIIELATSAHLDVRFELPL